MMKILMEKVMFIDMLIDIFGTSGESRKWMPQDSRLIIEPFC